MQYAKLVDGAPEIAVSPITVGDRMIWTTDFAAYGYKPLVFPPMPRRDGYHAEPDGWEETADAIQRVWALVRDEYPVAEGNVPKGEIFRCEGVYYRALAAIPRGEEVIEGSNATPVDVAEVLNSLEKE